MRSSKLRVEFIVLHKYKGWETLHHTDVVCFHKPYCILLIQRIYAAIRKSLFTSYTYIAYEWPWNRILIITLTEKNIPTQRRVNRSHNGRVLSWSLRSARLAVVILSATGRNVYKRCQWLIAQFNTCGD